MIDNKKQNNMTKEDEKRFIEAIFENYFLDNDNINFLTERGFNFFNLLDEENCFCLSGKQYKDCCYLKLNKQENKDYIPFLKAILNNENYDKYLTFSQNIIDNIWSKSLKEQFCKFPDCNNKAIENYLYINEFNNNSYYSSIKQNILDNNFKMGSCFFNKVSKDHFKYIGFCEKHYLELQKIDYSSKASDHDLLFLHFSTVVYKMFIAKLRLEALKEEFLNYFNSIQEEVVKNLFIYNLKKYSNHLRSLIEYYNFFKNILIQKNNNYKILKFELPKTNNFLIKDLFSPQITPEDFKTINSINNIFILEKFASIYMQVNKKNSLITIVFNKNDRELNAFFDQYFKKINNKTKLKETFISNCSLILADNILLEEKIYNKLTNDEKILYSALHKFRFEHPKMGQEYLKMQFFSGFDKGINLF